MLLEEIYESVSSGKNRDIIRRILNKLIINFEKFMDDNLDNEMLVVSRIIDDLNEKFYDMNIIFSIGDVNSDNYVSIGETDVSNGDIDIVVDRESLFSGENSLYSDSRLWGISLGSTITHELLHRTQIEKSGNMISGSSETNDSDYLSNKHEIQAHAKDAIDFISKFNSMNSSEKILDYLKHNLEDAKSEIEPIRNYWEMFGETDKKVWNRFLKYLIFYGREFV